MAKPWADQPYSLVPTPTEEQKNSVRNFNSPATITILHLKQKLTKLKVNKIVYQVAREMCLAHNAMILNLNAIFLQCEQITQPKDQADFIIFCQAAIEVIHKHHQMEEENFFPQIAEYTGEKDIMERNIEQHRSFDAGLTVFEEYIYKLTPEKYDGAELKRLLEGFASVLVVHLSEEIETLLVLQKYGKFDQLQKNFKRFNDKILSSVKDKVCPVSPYRK